MKREALGKLNRSANESGKGSGTLRPNGRGFDTVLAQLSAETGKSDGRETINSFRIIESLVGAGRFERPTPCAQGRCATRLRYAPTFAGLFILNHFAALRYQWGKMLFKGRRPNCS